MIETLQPGAGGRAIVKLLDGRALRHNVLHWKAGRAKPPAWAVDLLRAKLQRKHEHERTIAAQLEHGPGLRAGAKNLAAYLARQT